MPDVALEAARTDYDDAYEVENEFGDVAGIATFSVDRHWGGTPTGAVDPLPIRVYVMDGEDGVEGEHKMAYLTLEDAEEYRDALTAAIDQVRWTRHRRRIEP